MSSTPVIVRNATDAWVEQQNAGKNHGGAQQLGMKTSANNSFAYIHFTRPFPRGATIQAATLKVYNKGDWAGSHTLTAKRITEGWGESRITYNNRPAVSATDAAVVAKTGPSGGTEWAFDVQDIMQAVSDGEDYFGFRIELDTSTLRYIHSSEGGGNVKPLLSVTWTEAPDAPSVLAPSGGNAVSLAKPVLRFDFTDRLGSTALASVQVQIDAANNFVSGIDFDSTEVAATVPELDLNTTAYAGLADGSTTYWRVRVKDAAGLWSEWSDSASFKRENHGALTITSPAADPNDFVEEWTPLITWTFTGETQEAYQLILERVRATGAPVELWDSGKVVETDNSINVPAGFITNTTDIYRITVRVWDTQPREKTPGDQVYVEASRDFTYIPEGTPTSPSTLTAVADPGKPSVRLDWTRATAPDFFALKVDGVVVLPEIDPADVSAGGTAYSMFYYGALPGEEHEYEIEAVTSGVGSSDTNPTDTATINPVGIWIVDEDNPGVEVFIADRDDGDLTMGEDGATHFLVGAQAPVRIVSAFRGYEGTLNGLLVDQFTETSDDYEEMFFQIKAQANSNRTRLIFGGKSIPVILGNMICVPTARGTDEVRQVSFEFWQVGEFPFEVDLP